MTKSAQTAEKATVRERRENGKDFWVRGTNATPGVLDRFENKEDVEKRICNVFEKKRCTKRWQRGMDSELIEKK